MYGRKSELFAAMGPARIMAGAAEAVEAARKAGAVCVLVTGSGQGSLLGRLDSDFPDAFPMERRVTARDVVHGKPSPEPYLAGLAKAGVGAAGAIAIDNAPLGVRSASDAGIFTIGVRTGPIPAGALLASGADMELGSMHECAESISLIKALM